MLFCVMSHLRLFVLLVFLLPLLLEGCLGNTQYLPNPQIRSGAYVDIWNFSDSEINPKEVDKLYRKVARLLNIVPDPSILRPQVLLVPPAYIHERYLRTHPLTKTQDAHAIALYIASKDQILIPYFDRALLMHELVHYFSFHYIYAPRLKWEEIADWIVSSAKNMQ